MNIAIEYGVPTDRCGLQLRLGIEKGFFRDEGIDLALRIVFGGPEIAAEFDSAGKNQSETARRLGVSRPALIEKLHKYGFIGRG